MALTTIRTEQLREGAEFIKRDGSIAFTGNVDLGNNRITNLTSPVGDNDAATKGYVDAARSGLDVKQSVRAATTANITLSGTQTIDGVALSAGDRVLVKNQTTQTENGLYQVNVGAWTRTTDADSNAEVTSGMFTFVEEGTLNADSGWVLTTDGAVTLGTTNLQFVQFSGAGQITAGAGLTKTGNILDVGTGDGIQVDADSVTVKIDGTTLSKSAAGLKVPASGITSTELNPSVAGNGLSGGGGSPLEVNVAAAGSIEIVGDNLQVKLDGASLLSSAAGLKVNPAKFIFNEVPSGLTNNSNTVFTLANTPILDKQSIFLNGVLQKPGAGNDYTISGATITFNDAPKNNDVLLANYITA
jgi:hypothetical protein